MPEWLNGAVSKTVVRYAYRGFESLSLRVPKRSIKLRLEAVRKGKGEKSFR